MLKNKNMKCALIKNSSKELVYVIVLGISIAWNMFTGYLGYIMLLGLKDPSNVEEMNTLKVIMLFWPFIWVIALLFNMRFSINEYRKKNYVIGLLAVSIMWLTMGWSYSFDSFWLPKFAGVWLHIFLGLSLVSTYFAMINDVGDETLIAISIGVAYFGNFIIMFAMPYLIANQQNYKYFSFGAGVLTLGIAIFLWFFLLETKGLEKADVFQLLRKLKTRKELRAERKASFRSISSRVSSRDISVLNSPRGSNYG